MKYEPDNFRNPIRKEEIENLRSRIQIGDVLPRKVIWVQKDGPGVIRLELKGGNDNGSED